MTEVQLWSIGIAALFTAVMVAVISIRRRKRRADDSGHIVVDMVVPKAPDGSNAPDGQRPLG